MLSFAIAVFSYQFVVALVLSDTFWNCNISSQSCPVHLKDNNSYSNNNNNNNSNQPAEVFTSSVAIVSLSSTGSMTTSSFTHLSDGRGSPFTSAGMSTAAPFFTMMALLLKNFRIVITGATVDQ